MTVPTQSPRTPSPGSAANSAAGPALLRHPWAQSIAKTDGVYRLLAVTAVSSYLIILIAGGSFGLESLLVRSVALAIVASGQAMVVISGSIDLSVAQNLTLAAMVGARVMDASDSNLILGIVAALAISVVVGVANGVIVAWLGVNGFIATLGMSLVLTGQLALFFAENAPQSASPSLVDSLGFGSIGLVPISVALMVVVAVVAGAILRFTRIGAHMYAVGGDTEIAGNAGIKPWRPLLSAHALCGFTAGIAGVYLASRLGTPNIEVGTNGVYDLESIAVVVLGGAALLGGKGRVGTTIGAVLVFALVDAVFTQLEVDPFLKLVVRGVIIIGAVGSYTIRGGEEAS